MARQSASRAWATFLCAAGLGTVVGLGCEGTGVRVQPVGDCAIAVAAREPWRLADGSDAGPTSGEAWVQDYTSMLSEQVPLAASCREAWSGEAPSPHATAAERVAGFGEVDTSATLPVPFLGTDGVLLTMHWQEDGESWVTREAIFTRANRTWVVSANHAKRDAEGARQVAALLDTIRWSGAP